MGRRQRDAFRRRQIGGEHGGALRAGRIEHSHRVVHPVLSPSGPPTAIPGRTGPHPAGRSGSAGEGGQPPHETGHGRLFVHALDRDDRPREQEQVDRAVAEDLVGDIDASPTLV
jgi:hypothetical protein